VFLNRLGEIRDRSFENQRDRASGLNRVVAAIVLWNTLCVERAVQALRDSGKDVDARLLSQLSAPGREHISLTGDYTRRQSRRTGKIPAATDARRSSAYDFFGFASGPPPARNFGFFDGRAAPFPPQ
jgi:hypothetical protein